MTVPENLNIAQAELPKTYEAAKATLGGCTRIAECKRWADKAEGLAAYARIVEDKTLLLFAHRVRARAVRRAGELLKEFDGSTRAGSRATPTTQRQAAADAGMSKDQQVTAVRVANVSKDEFEAQVESDHPPTITALANLGIQKRRTKEANHQ